MCKEKLHKGETVILLLKNYNMTFQNKVQSAIWDTKQVTIHTMVSYYLQNVDEETILKKHSVIGATFG